MEMFIFHLVLLMYQLTDWFAWEKSVLVLQVRKHLHLIITSKEEE